MMNPDRERTAASSDTGNKGSYAENGKVCKTFIRRFDSDPRLQQLSEKKGVYGDPELPADSSEIANNHRSASCGPGEGRTAERNGPTPSHRWRRLSTVKDAGEYPGVYVLICGGRAVYVGQSIRLLERLRGHRWRFERDGIRTPKGFYQGAYVKVRNCRRFGEWLMLEARLIRRLSPIENVRLFERAHSGRAVGEVQPDGSLLIDFDTDRLYGRVCLISGGSN